MPTNNQQQSFQSITIELGPTFGSSPNDIPQVRNNRVSRIEGLTKTEAPIFAIERPLEIAGVAVRQSDENPTSPQSATSMLTFVPAGEPIVRGTAPNVHIRNALGMHGHIDRKSNV